MNKQKTPEEVLNPSWNKYKLNGKSFKQIALDAMEVYAAPLQARIAELERENADLREERSEMFDMLKEVKQENARYREDLGSIDFLSDSTIHSAARNKRINFYAQQALNPKTKTDG